MAHDDLRLLRWPTTRVYLYDPVVGRVGSYVGHIRETGICAQGVFARSIGAAVAYYAIPSQRDLVLQHAEWRSPISLVESASFRRTPFGIVRLDLRLQDGRKTLRERWFEILGDGSDDPLLAMIAADVYDEPERIRKYRTWVNK